MSRWLDDRMSDRPSGQVFREFMEIGAVISGRRTFEPAGRWQGDHHDGVPIFVLTRRIDDGDAAPAARSSSPTPKTAPSGPAPQQAIVL